MTTDDMGSIIKRHRSAVIVLWIFSVFFNVLMLTTPLYMLAVFSHVLTSRSQDTLALLTAAAIAALCVQALLDLVRSRLLVRMGASLESELGPVALQRSITAASNRTHGGGNAIKDVSALRTFLAGSGMLTLFDVPFVPLYLAVVFLLHPALGALATIGSVLLICLAILNEWIARGPIGEAIQSSRSLNRILDEYTRGAEAILSMGMISAATRQWRKIQIRSVDATMIGADRTGVARSGTRFVRVLLQVGLYATGAWLYVDGQVMVGAIVAASILMGRALAPIEGLMGAWRGLVDARHAYAHLKSELATALSGSGDRDAISRSSIGKISLDKVSIASTGGERFVLRGVSFDLAAGQLLGIVGPSGAGKSTLGRVILGLCVPKAGTVRIEGTQPAERGADSLGSLIGYLSQEVQIFNTTIRSNIARLADTPESVAAAEQAASIVGLHAEIEQLPKGYDTVVGEGGSLISAGMRQHIAIARAFFGNPRLIVLDEPSAHLDAAAEAGLVRAIAHAKGLGATVVIITHQSALLKQADKLLVLRHGAVEAFGSRTSVMSKLALAETPATRRKAAQTVAPEPDKSIAQSASEVAA